MCRLRQSPCQVLLWCRWVCPAVPFPPMMVLELPCISQAQNLTPRPHDTRTWTQSERDRRMRYTIAPRAPSRRERRATPHSPHSSDRRTCGPCATSCMHRRLCDVFASSPALEGAGRSRQAGREVRRVRNGTSTASSFASACRDASVHSSRGRECRPSCAVSLLGGGLREGLGWWSSVPSVPRPTQSPRTYRTHLLPLLGATLAFSAVLLSGMVIVWESVQLRVCCRVLSSSTSRDP